jgi:hypothetical protein
MGEKIVRITKESLGNLPKNEGNVLDMVVSGNHSSRRSFTRAKEYIRPTGSPPLLCDIEE